MTNCVIHYRFEPDRRPRRPLNGEDRPAAPRFPMIEFLWGVLVFLIRTIIFVLDIVVFVSDIRHFARWATGSASIVDVPAEAKTLPPAALRALDEAEQRRKANYAANGTVQAS
jgi:hypothetical protein